jgi:hypothetical protein
MLPWAFDPSRLLCVVPLTLRAPRSLRRASGSEEPSACRGRRGGPRGGRRLGCGRGLSRSVALVLRGAPWCVQKRRWGSEELRWCSLLRRCLQTPVGPARRPPRRVGLSGPWSGSPLLRGGLVCRAWEGASAPPFRGRVGWRCPGAFKRGWPYRLQAGGGAGASVLPRLRGGLGALKLPLGPQAELGASPGRSASSPGVVLPRKGERFASRG